MQVSTVQIAASRGGGVVDVLRAFLCRLHVQRARCVSQIPRVAFPFHVLPFVWKVEAEQRTTPKNSLNPIDNSNSDKQLCGIYNYKHVDVVDFPKTKLLCTCVYLGV